MSSLHPDPISGLHNADMGLGSTDAESVLTRLPTVAVAVAVAVAATVAVAVATAAAAAATVSRVVCIRYSS